MKIIEDSLPTHVVLTFLNEKLDHECWQIEPMVSLILFLSFSWELDAIVTSDISGTDGDTPGVWVPWVLVLGLSLVTCEGLWRISWLNDDVTTLVQEGVSYQLFPWPSHPLPTSVPSHLVTWTPYNNLFIFWLSFRIPLNILNFVVMYVFCYYSDALPNTIGNYFVIMRK